ncbi:unnamed protein product [Orchesella dallaii]|uniref:2'-5'-oligoadenylate synthetase 1 domain-containing protein n=1 Tax=Orchesella dallaii TaxID=48710 RepID=A0ABP1S6R1_9HEXA
MHEVTVMGASRNGLHDTDGFTWNNGSHEVQFVPATDTETVEMGSQTRQKPFDAALTAFGQSLGCSEKFYDEGKALAQRVFLKLQDKSKYSVARVHFGGSFGKKTDVIEPDLDLVVVCNKIDPPLDNVNVLDDFENVLMMHDDELKIREGPFKITERSLNFSFKNGIEVDLLPAANVTDLEEIRNKMRMDPKNAFYYNPSFVDQQVAFLRSQNSFTHTLIRLVKFWFKNLHFGQNVGGGSAMMEMISISAAEDEGNYDSLSMLRAFAKGLDIIAKLDSLKLAFRCVAVTEKIFRWEKIPSKELHEGNQDLIPKVIGNENILKRKYFMVDPANPFQDFLEGKAESLIDKLKMFASETRDELRKVVYGNVVGKEFIQSLLKPRPTSLVEEAEGTLSLPSDFCVGVGYTSYSSLVCDMKVRNNSVMQEIPKKNSINTFKQRLLAIVNATVNANQETVTSDDVRNAVQSMIKTSLKVGLDQSPYNHDEMDVTLTIPYRINATDYEIRFSMRWN